VILDRVDKSQNSPLWRIRCGISVIEQTENLRTARRPIQLDHTLNTARCGHGPTLWWCGLLAMLDLLRIQSLLHAPFHSSWDVSADPQNIRSAVVCYFVNR